MKILLTLFVLLFSSSVVAEDISDFQIEGINLGDNLLDHYNIEEIINSKYYVHEYKNIPFKYYIFDTDTESNYDYLQITIKIENQYITKSANQKLIIHEVKGLIYYINDMKSCLSQMLIIKNNLEDFFNIDGVEDSGISSTDTTKETTYNRFLFYINPNSNYSDASIVCKDWGKTMEKDGWRDSLTVGIKTQEFIEQISLYEYK